MQVTPGRQHVGGAQEVAAGRRARVAAVERVDHGRQLVVDGEQLVEASAFDRLGDPGGIEHAVALFLRRRLADDVQAVRDQRVFEFEQVGGDLLDAAAQLDGLALRPDQLGQRVALLGIRFRLHRPPTVDRGFQVQQPAIQARMRDRRRQVGNQRRRSPALGDHALGRIVRRIQIDIGKVTDQPVRPALAR